MQMTVPSEKESSLSFWPVYGYSVTTARQKERGCCEVCLGNAGAHVILMSRASREGCSSGAGGAFWVLGSLPQLSQ